MPNNNKKISASITAKKDEFYTQLPDIENELKHYKSYFKDKIVYCNCDDALDSNFVLYFKRKFKDLGLKKLIATNYGDSPTRLKCATRFDFDGDDGLYTPLDGNGSYDSPECLDALVECDVVVTNPPFSKIKHYLPLMADSGKKILVLAPNTSMFYKPVFPYFRDGKLWLGHTLRKKQCVMRIPYDYSVSPSAYVDNGKKYVTMRNIRWVTNIGDFVMSESLKLTAKYDPDVYPCYMDYDAINVDKTVNIPCDYDGLMGVPISFFDKYDPRVFEIVDVVDPTLIDGRQTFRRIIIRRRKHEVVKS